MSRLRRSNLIRLHRNSLIRLHRSLTDIECAQITENCGHVHTKNRIETAAHPTLHYHNMAKTLPKSLQEVKDISKDIDMNDLITVLMMLDTKTLKNISKEVNGLCNASRSRSVENIITHIYYES